ncbi:acetate--CoA ligase family protein [Rhodococcus pseudokoreensis]|uniref:Acetate--CoA ligase family protein n=1 Tax=Rhodococcus pseudokoreensis TaxID=2811421 RepID=A0A974ZW34_9NOCA|nr:acetate--CoA ligase family protein [Rhodococcus pseudokoreensis]QSE92616.1 acetate--CoA ligase family protein [Rhodococcus pseudokoreensis]
MTSLALAPPLTRRDLTALFDPSSIAIVGASNDPAKYGNWLAVRALRDQIRRPAYLINKTRPTILDHPAVPSLTALDAPVDLAVIAVPAAGFDEAVDDAIAANVRAIVAITAGLGESGADGLARQNALVARLRDAEIPMLGPNCLGVLDNTTGLDATVNEFRPGSVSIISQSGNVAIDLAEHFTEQGLGVARFASLGNCADLDVADLIDSCVDHEGTAAIAVYCEGFKDGRKFARAAARAADAGKPVVLLSVGRGAASTRGAASHTGSLVTSSVVLEAVCEATGTELVSSPFEMANLLQALVRTRPPAGSRVAVLADGGGHASLASDSLEDAGLHVEEFSAELSARVAGELPPTAATSNPIDLAGGGEQDITCFARVAQRLIDAPEADAVLMTGFFGGYGDYDPAVAPGEIQAGHDIGALVAESEASFIAQTMFADSKPAQAMRESGIAVYRNVEHAAWALSRLSRRAQAGAHPLPVLPEPAAPLTETGYWPARRALTAAGIPFVPAAEVSTIAELEAAVAGLQFPLVLKALGDEHKSDNGGVILNIADHTALVEAWDDVQARLAPPVCSIEEMADLSGAVELIIGVRRDPTFGPIVLVGIGGVYTELLEDTRCALGPVTAVQARELLLSLRGSALLTGFRRKPAVDVDAAANLVATLSAYAAEHPEIGEIECNPIAVTPTAAVALDARIILDH